MNLIAFYECLPLQEQNIIVTMGGSVELCKPILISDLVFHGVDLIYIKRFIDGLVQKDLGLLVDNEFIPSQSMRTLIQRVWEERDY